jgi:hypothetical protein
MSCYRFRLVSVEEEAERAGALWAITTSHFRLSLEDRPMAAKQKQRSPHGLVHENADGEVDGPEQRGASREGGSGTRVGRYEHYDPCDGPHRDHDSPPLAEYKPHEQQGRNHRSSLRCKGRPRRRRSLALGRVGAIAPRDEEVLSWGSSTTRREAVRMRRRHSPCSRSSLA